MARKMTLRADYRIVAARDRDYQIHIHGYCESPDCTVRGVDIRVKDYDRELVQQLSQRVLSCPVCGSTLNVHGAETASECARRKEVHARRSVNLQMRWRDQGWPDLRFARLSDMEDDRLPPTPDGWFKS